VDDFFTECPQRSGKSVHLRVIRVTDVGDVVPRQGGLFMEPDADGQCGKSTRLKYSDTFVCVGLRHELPFGWLDEHDLRARFGNSLADATDSNRRPQSRHTGRGRDRAASLGSARFCHDVIPAVFSELSWGISE
jgi:hypothetical protein